MLLQVFYCVFFIFVDTHYLLYIYDRMRNDLVSNSNPITLNLINALVERSCITSLNIYTKDIYGSLDSRGAFAWEKTLRKLREPINEAGIEVFKALHEFRDQHARILDESPRFLMNDKALFILSKVCPMYFTIFYMFRSVQDLMGCLNVNLSQFLRLHANDCVMLIKSAIDVTKTKNEKMEIETKSFIEKKAHTRFNNAATIVEENALISAHHSSALTSNLIQFDSKSVSIGTKNSVNLIVTLTSNSSLFNDKRKGIDSVFQSNFTPILPFETMVLDEEDEVEDEIERNDFLRITPTFDAPVVISTRRLQPNEITTSEKSIENSNDASPEAQANSPTAAAAVELKSSPIKRAIIEEESNNDSARNILITGEDKDLINNQNLKQPRSKKQKKKKQAINSGEFVPFDYSKATFKDDKIGDDVNNSMPDFKPHGMPLDSGYARGRAPKNQRKSGNKSMSYRSKK